MPEPTHLILFDHLCRTAPGTKVRFLAWYASLTSASITSTLRTVGLTSASVYSYAPQTGQVILHDRTTTTADHSIPPAIVNVNNILENLSREVLEVGAWVNVIGTVRANEGFEKISKSWWRRAFGSHVKMAPCPLVDATMVWSAVAVKLEEYRESVKAYRDALKDE